MGCDPGDTSAPDATVGASGLSVEWSSSPSTWPSSPEDGLTIEKARFALDSLRVVGDAGPGDPRTSIANMELGFDWDSVGQRPSTIAFDDAPTGLYSQVALAFDGGTEDAFEIRGHVRVNSVDWEYRIQDSQPLTFNVGISEMVSPGETAVVRLRINFAHALDIVDFATLDTSDGRLELDNGDSQMSQFRATLIESFEVAAGSSGAR
jgi:hypothetical protein